MNQTTAAGSSGSSRRDIKSDLQHNGALMSDAEATAYLDLASGTLSVWRCTGRYNLPFIKVGRAVRYRKADLDAWLASRTRTAA